MKVLPINKIGKINAFPEYITHYSGNVFPTKINISCGRGALWEWEGTSVGCTVLYPRPRPWV